MLRSGASGSFPESYAEPAAAEAPAETWTALYEYAATEADEISFQEGDALVEVTPYTDGWLR